MDQTDAALREALAQWEALSRACWDCGKIQTVFPEFWLCEECRSQPAWQRWLSELRKDQDAGTQ